MPPGDNLDPKKLDEYNKKFKELYATELNRLKISQEVNTNLDSYFDTLENTAKAQALINESKEEMLEIAKKIKTTTGEEKEYLMHIWKGKKKTIQDQQKLLNMKREEASLLKSSWNTTKKVVKERIKEEINFKKIYQYLLDSDKAMKQTQLKMGLGAKRTEELRDNMKGAVAHASAIGVSMADLGRATQNFSKELGRARIPSKQLMTDMAEVAKGTGMSTEEVGTFTGQLLKAGIPTQQMKVVMSDIVNSAAQMGLNVEAVTESLKQNVGLMNKLHFKDGIKGLMEMVKISERFRLQVSEIAALSDKLFRPEGAIELAANLQMMGGEFSRMADPMTLMYQARNAPEELAKSIAKATAESAIFNAETGKFKVSALELDRLKQVANMTGMSYESLVESAKAAAKETQIAGKLAFNVDDKQLSLLASAAEFKDGEFQIQIPGKEMVAMKNLTHAQLQAISENKESLKERALRAKAFDEALAEFFEVVRSTFLPLIEVLNILITPIQMFSQAIAGLPGWGKFLVMGLTVALMMATKLMVMSLNATFGKWWAKSSIKAWKDKFVPQKTTSTTGPATKGQSGFMKQLLKISPKQLLAFGAAFILIGTGVAIAALGLAQFVKAFKDLTPEQTSAVNSALLGFGIALGVVMIGLLAFSALAPILGIGVGVLLAFGGAVALIGLGVGLAAAGLSLLVGAFGEIDPAQIAATAGSFVLLGYAFGALAMTLPIMGLVIGALVGIALATHLIDDEAVGNLAKSLTSINDLSSEKIGQLTALFKAAGSARPLIVFHTPIEISGTVTLDAGDVQMDLDMSSVAKKITDTVQGQLYLRKEGMS